MSILRLLQEGAALQLTRDPWLVGVEIRIEEPENVLADETCPFPGARITVLAPALVVNEADVWRPAGGRILVDESAVPIGTEDCRGELALEAPMERVLKCEALLSIEARFDARMNPAVRPLTASGLAEQALCVLHGWEHGLGRPGVLRAERQALTPGPVTGHPMSYVARYASGGKEKFRRELNRMGERETGVRYYLHFYTDIELVARTL